LLKAVPNFVRTLIADSFLRRFPMKVGIIGAGQVGTSLGKALTRVGHEVMFSSREPQSEKMQAVLKDVGAKASAGTVAEALAYGEVIALALRWDAVADAAKVPGWSGKIVIDMTNRFGGSSPLSTAEDVAALTGARVVKALNTIGAEHYQNPRIGGQAATMFIAGDDAAAKQKAGQLISDIGFDVVDIGPLSAARHLDNLAAFWVYMSRSRLGRNVAFKLLRDK
jgi:8-hydroxy-5-deazaflavin:NADPH oxidoreductase